MAKAPKKSTNRPGYWLLQDAKARFSELVRRVRTDGPQHVTSHGRDEVVVISAEEFRRLKGNPTGKDLTDALSASPHRHIEIEAARTTSPVRGVTL
jgi:prevent-host-death family protein